VVSTSKEAAEKDFFNKEVAEFSEKGFPVPQKTAIAPFSLKD
jgi:hypothetical protein